MLEASEKLDLVFAEPKDLNKPEPMNISRDEKDFFAPAPKQADVPLNDAEKDVIAGSI